MDPVLAAANPAARHAFNNVLISCILVMGFTRHVDGESSLCAEVRENNVTSATGGRTQQLGGDDKFKAAPRTMHPAPAGCDSFAPLLCKAENPVQRRA
jgi:hypothetical protein